MSSRSRAYRNQRIKQGLFTQRCPAARHGLGVEAAHRGLPGRCRRSRSFCEPPWTPAGTRCSCRSGPRCPSTLQTIATFCKNVATLLRSNSSHCSRTFSKPRAREYPKFPSPTTESKSQVLVDCGFGDVVCNNVLGDKAQADIRHLRAPANCFRRIHPCWTKCRSDSKTQSSIVCNSRRACSHKCDTDVR